jgi:DNA polymerase-4
VPLDQRLRLLGVRVSALVPLDEAGRHQAGEQGELFPG